jgi:hypothetical protein
MFSMPPVKAAVMSTPADGLDANAVTVVAAMVTIVVPTANSFFLISSPPHVMDLNIFNV